MTPGSRRRATLAPLNCIACSMPVFYLPSSRALVRLAFVVSLAWSSGYAQTPPAADSSGPPPTEALRPVMVQISQTLANVNVLRWKAPADVKGTAQQDMDSILRDLNSTLPPLLDQAAASPGSLAATFAVYRNIDALYDVLLRVSQTAILSGAQNDAVGLQGALDNLQGARKQLGNSLTDLATAHDQELVKLRAAAAAAPPAEKQTAPASKVIEDGPPASASTRRKKATKSAPATQKPAPAPQ